jgi:hypothetical protein
MAEKFRLCQAIYSSHHSGSHQIDYYKIYSAIGKPSALPVYHLPAILPHRPETSDMPHGFSVRSFTEAVASYTHARFQEERVKQLSAMNKNSAATGSSHIQDMSSAVIPPIGLAVPMVAECDRLAEMLATAFLNPGEPRLCCHVDFTE